jgi:hypothetical protein
VRVSNLSFANEEQVSLESWDGDESGTESNMDGAVELGQRSLSDFVE